MCSKLKQKQLVNLYPGEILPRQIFLGVLTVALGSPSPLLGFCMLCTPGFRYASFHVGVYCNVENAWQTHENGSE